MQTNNNRDLIAFVESLLTKVADHRFQLQQELNTIKTQLKVSELTLTHIEKEQAAVKNIIQRSVWGLVNFTLGVVGLKLLFVCFKYL